MVKWAFVGVRESHGAIPAMSRDRLSLVNLCQPTDSSQPPTPTSMTPPAPAAVHAGTKRPLTLDDQDEDVLIAVRALGDMRSRAVAHAHAPSPEAFAAAAKAHSRTCQSRSSSLGGQPLTAAQPPFRSPHHSSPIPRRPRPPLPRLRFLRCLPSSPSPRGTKTTSASTPRTLSRASPTSPSSTAPSRSTSTQRSAPES